MFGWLDWEKLRQEWKTAALAVVGLLLEIYDAVAPFVDLPSLFPPDLRPWVSPTILVLMLLLRKWKDGHG
jgi:hypothetical protein